MDKEKEKGKSFSFQWYPKDILSSERVSVMDLREEGAYRRALDFCWLKGSVPADLKLLAKLIGKGCTVKIAEVISTMFVADPEDGSRLVHTRLQEEKKKQDEWREKSSKAGKKSALLRQQKSEVGPEANIKVGSNLVNNQNTTNVKPTLQNGTNQNPTLPLPLSPLPLPIISSSSTPGGENENIENGPSKILIEKYPSQHMIKAKGFGMPHEEIESELKKFDEHHGSYEFKDERHVLNSWGIWCSMYQERKTKPKNQNGYKKQQESITKPEFHAPKGPEAYY